MTRLALVTLALVTAFGLAEWSFTPPAPRPDAPPEAFSGTRALEAWRAALGPARPHPVGSTEAAALRGRLKRQLEALGYPVREQRAVACTHGACAEVRNLIAVAPAGQIPETALVAHYDSVPAGPGASDGGLGVAVVLEVARALRAAPPERPVLLLLTEGEEAGLLGARAFLDEAPEAGPLRAVVNLEARGTSGASLMFETGLPGGPLVRHYGAVDRPVSSSLFETVYRRLPNDTDFTLFRRAGRHGFNLAVLKDVARYHTPKDDLEHLDPGSLQHLGDSALTLVRSLTSGAAPSPGETGGRVWMDLFGLTLLHWPDTVTPVSAVLFGLIALAWLLRGPRRGLGWVVAGLLLAGFYVAVGDRLLWWALRLAGGATTAHPPAPWPRFYGFWAGALAVLALAAGWIARRAPAPEGAQSTRRVVFAFLAAAHLPLWTMPGLGFLLLGPALGVLLDRRHVAAPLLAMLVWCPVAVGVRDAMGTPGGLLTPLVGAILLLTFLPLLVDAPPRSRAAFAGLAAVVALGTIAWDAASPEYTPDHPAPSILWAVHDTDSGGTAWWVSGPWQGEDSGAPPAQRPELPFARFRFRAARAPAPELALPAPEVEVLAPGRLRIRSSRGARVLHVILPPETRGTVTTLGGVGAPPPRRRAGWRSYSWLSTTPEGLEVTLRARGRVLVADQAGLDEAAAPVLALRPSWAGPIHEGDATLSLRTVTLASGGPPPP